MQEGYYWGDANVLNWIIMIVIKLGIVTQHHCTEHILNGWILWSANCISIKSLTEKPLKDFKQGGR